ncbi:MAG: alternative ribosome rescue aminoacyl-tRNA hydrolase ArfB [Acidimicrobiia bacterium]|nr:alternative ribosome rescue aminoacyl-tRNA hydrolase ArfB [Acidimicrobiia bacterium]
MDDLAVTGQVVIPSRELIWRFDPSGGPGGQHANRSSTRVALSFDVVRSSALSEDLRERVIASLGDQLEEGIVTVQVSATRSQWRNRQLARRKLASLLAEAMRPPASPRRSTKPSRASRERRLADKRARAETKRLRRRPTSPD